MYKKLCNASWAFILYFVIDILYFAGFYLMFLNTILIIAKNDLVGKKEKEES